MGGIVMVFTVCTKGEENCVHFEVALTDNHKFGRKGFKAEQVRTRYVSIITISWDERELHPPHLMEIHVIYMHTKFEKHLPIWWLLNISSGLTCLYDREGYK